MITDTPKQNDQETNGPQTITDSLPSQSSPDHLNNDDQLEIEEPRGHLTQAIYSAFSSVISSLSGKKSQQKSEIFETEKLEPALDFTPGSGKGMEDHPIMETVMEAVEKEEYAVQEFVVDAIEISEEPVVNAVDEGHNEGELEVQAQEEIQVEMQSKSEDNEEQSQGEEKVETYGEGCYQEVVEDDRRESDNAGERVVEEESDVIEIEREGEFNGVNEERNEEHREEIQVENHLLIEENMNEENLNKENLDYQPEETTVQNVVEVSSDEQQRQEELVVEHEEENFDSQQSPEEILIESVNEVYLIKEDSDNQPEENVAPSTLEENLDDHQQEQQEVIEVEKMEEEPQPEPEAEPERLEEHYTENNEDNAYSNHEEAHEAPVVETAEVVDERKAESPFRQSEVLSHHEEVHHRSELAEEQEVDLNEPILSGLDAEEAPREVVMQQSVEIIQILSQEDELSQEKNDSGVETQPASEENREEEQPQEVKSEEHQLDQLLQDSLQDSPKGLNHTEDEINNTLSNSNQMVIENEGNEEDEVNYVVPVLEYQSDHNENDITRIEEMEEDIRMIEVQDPIEECPESQEVTSLLPMMEINAESLNVSTMPIMDTTIESTDKPQTPPIYKPARASTTKKAEVKKSIPPPTRVVHQRNPSVPNKKPFSEVKQRGAQFSVPKTGTTKPKFGADFASLTAQKKPQIARNNQVTVKRDNVANKSFTNTPQQKKPLVAQQQVNGNNSNTKKRKAEEVWTKNMNELKHVKKNTQPSVSRDKERINVFQARNNINNGTAMRPPQNRTPRASVDKNALHKGKPSNENEPQNEAQNRVSNKPACVVCECPIEKRADSKMLSCLHKIHEKCSLALEKKKGQCPACNSTGNRDGFKKINTTPGTKRHEKKMVY